MLMTPWQLAKKLWNWVRLKFRPPIALPPPVAPPLKLQHFIRSKQIVPGRVIVMNTSDQNIRLESPVLPLLFIRAGGITTVPSPLLEPVWRIKKVGMEDPADDQSYVRSTKSVEKEIAFVNEWDALEVIDSMIEEYVRACAYDLLSPEDLKHCTLPLAKTDPVMQMLYERIGLVAQRENENVPAQA